jgi:hypothetical protein
MGIRHRKAQEHLLDGRDARFALEDTSTKLTRQQTPEPTQAPTPAPTPASPAAPTLVPTPAPTPVEQTGSKTFFGTITQIVGYFIGNIGQILHALDHAVQDLGSNHTTTTARHVHPGR